MMFCLGCASLFEQAKHAIERHGLDSPPYEEFLVCPRCGDSDIRQARRCDLCGEWITAGFILTQDRNRICEECYTRHDIQDE